MSDDKTLKDVIEEFNNSENNIDYVYLTIPFEYVCIYHKLLSAMADFGKQMINNKCCKNNSVIDCWNMFQSAIVCKNIGRLDDANKLIDYIKKQLPIIYKGSPYKEYVGGTLPMSITKNGILKVLVTCNYDKVKFKVNIDTGRLIQVNDSKLCNCKIVNNNLITIKK